MINVLIIAGGVGTRFWPKSTEKKPKQFVNLIGNKTMLQMTIDRVKKITSMEHIFISTNSHYVDLVLEQIPEISKENIIIEPVGRNTAPCILLSTMIIDKKYPNSNIAVFPADHILREEDNFVKTIETANQFLKDNKGIITIGIQPTRPETGYGYIKMSTMPIGKNNFEVIKVDKFVEKPNLEKATEYLSTNKYLWNAGMFVYNSKYMIEEFEDKMPKMSETINCIINSNDEEYMKNLFEKYELCEKISIDYAIIEKSNNIYVIPADLGWDDIGTWPSLQRYIEPDDDDNYLKGNVEMINSKNNIVYSLNKKIILYNINDIFCIDSDDVIIIGNKANIKDVHELGKR